MMTGSAKFAWFIAAVLFNSAVLGGQAQGAAPKDALKYLKLTHISSIKLTENDLEPMYKNNYRGDWFLDWKPPGVKLAGMGSLFYKVHYSQTLIDNLDKLTPAYNTDSRTDYYKVDLSTNGIKNFFISYSFDRSDTFQNNKQRSSSSNRLVNIQFIPPEFPTFDYSNLVSSRNGSTGNTITSGSESSNTTYHARFKRDIGHYGQDYQYRYVVNSSTTGLNDKAQTQFKGYRQMKFDQFGTLTMSYDFVAQDSYQDVGRANNKSTNNNFGLSLNNSLGALPISYNFTFTNVHASSPRIESSTETKFIKLTYRPPMPSGKNLTISFDKQMKEYLEKTGTWRHTAEDRTNLRWGFNTNPLTSGEIKYGQFLSTDIQDKQLNSKDETVSGRLTYSIPGNQGNLNATISHNANSNQNGQRNTDFVDLQNKFNLGRLANITLFYNQRYSGTGLPRSDVVFSGVRYHLAQKKAGIALDASWKQQMSRPNDFTKDTLQSFFVHLSYRTPSNIRYDFLVNERNNADTMNLRSGRNSFQKTYQSKNEVEFKVTYAF